MIDVWGSWQILWNLRERMPYLNSLLSIAVCYIGYCSHWTFMWKQYIADVRTSRSRSHSLYSYPFCVLSQAISIYIAFCTIVNRIHAMRIMCFTRGLNTIWWRISTYICNKNHPSENLKKDRVFVISNVRMHYSCHISVKVEHVVFGI